MEGGACCAAAATATRGRTARERSYERESSATEFERCDPDLKPIAERGAGVGDMHALHRRVPWELRGIQERFPRAGDVVPGSVRDADGGGGQRLPG